MPPLSPVTGGSFQILAVFRLLSVIFAAVLVAVPHFASGQISLQSYTDSVVDGAENVKAIRVWSNNSMRMPVVNFKSVSSHVDEEAQEHSIQLTIEITITPAPADRFELEYTVGEHSTAESLTRERRDYTIAPLSSSPIQVFPDDNSAEIRLTINNDWYAEEDETIILILQPDDPDDRKYTLGSKSVHTVTIESSDPTIISDVDFHRDREFPRPESDQTWDITVFLSAGMYLGDDGNLHPAPDIPGIIENSVAPEKGLTLNYELGGTAEPGEDYTIAQSTIQVPGNKSSGMLYVEILDDNVQEDTETIILTLIEGDGYNVGTKYPSIMWTIEDDDTTPLPKAAFALASSGADEDAGTHNITVNIDPAPQTNLILNYTWNGGTAVEGEDYRIEDKGTVSVTAGNTLVNIPIMIIDDNADEVDETIILTLTSGAGYDVGNPDTHTLTITDNDTPVVRFESVSKRVDEDAGRHNVIVNIDPAPQTDLILNYTWDGGTAVEGEDYRIEDKGTVSVTTGNTSVNIPVTIIDDNADEEDETVILTLTSGSGYDLGNPNPHTLTISDNDETPVVRFESVSERVDEDAGTHNIIVKINPAPQTDLILNYTWDGGTAVEGEDYRITGSGAIAVTAGATSVNIPIIIIDDNADEVDETVILTLKSGTGYDLGNPNSHTLTITDNDETPVIRFESVSERIDEDAGTHNVIVKINPAPQADLTLTYDLGGTATEGTDYRIIGSGAIAVTAGATSVNIPVMIIDDNADEVDETVILTLKSGTGYDLGNPNPHRLTITDNDETSVVNFVLASSDVNESAGTHNVTVNINPAPQSDLTLEYDLGGTAAEGSDYSINNSRRIAVRAGASSASIPIMITDDGEDEEAETVILTLKSGTGYDLGNPNSHTLTITDNDETPVVRFESVSERVDEDAGTHNVIVKINPAPQADLPLTYDLGGTATEGTDYSITGSGAIAVTAGATSVNIPVMIIDDNADEGSETIILTLTSGSGYDLGNPNPHTLTIINNDGTALPEATFALVSESIDEDAGTHNVIVNVGPASPADLVLSYDLGGTAVEEEDYSIRSSRTVTVTAGATSVNIPVMITDDLVVEANETIEFTLITGTGYTTGSTKAHTVTIEDNDQPVPATVMLTANPKRVEEGASVEVTVTISVKQPGNVVIPLTYIPLDPYPATSADYHSLPSIVIPAGALTGSDNLRTIDDDSYEEDETFTVAIDEELLPADIELGSPVSERITITNNDSEPPVQGRISVVPRIVEEGNSVTVTIELPVELSLSVTIALVLTPISAEPEDYRAPTPRQVEIRAGQMHGEYRIAIHDDKEAREGDETFTVAVDEDGVPDEVGFDNLSPVTVTIIDNDQAGIQALTAVSILEGQTETFQFSLTSEPQAEVTVTISGHSGTDLILTPAVKIFLPSNWSEMQEVTLHAVEDLDFDHELVPLTFTASGGGYTGISEIVEVTIIDKDRPGINAPASVVVPEGLSGRFDIVLVKEPSGIVTVTVPSPVGDITAVPTNLIFTPDTWQTPQSITLTAREDDDFLPDFETLTLRANGGGYEGVTQDIAVTIRENDEPGIMALEEVTMDEGSTYPLMVRLTAQPLEPVTINFTGHTGSDLTLSGVPITFTAMNWQTPQRVTLIAAEDDMDYINDRIDLILIASGGGYDDVTHTTIVTIKDNDDAPLMISILNQEGMESGESLQLRIELNRSIDEPVTVEYTSSDVGEAEAGLDYTASRGIVIFDPGATRGVIEIKITDDQLPEENETFHVTLSNASDNAEIYRAVGVGTILDNDGSAKLRVDNVLVMEEEGNVQFRVSLSQPQHQTVTAVYRTKDGTAKSGEDYKEVSGVVTIAPGMMEAIIAVPLLRDGLDWQEETFSVHLLSAKHAEIEKAVGLATIQESPVASEKIMEAYIARFLRTASVQMVDAIGGRFRLAADGVVCAAADRAEMAHFWYSTSSWDPSLGELLAGCHMSQNMPLGSGSFGVWGQGAFRRFNGRGEDALTLQGDVTTGMFGVDYRWQGGWIVGMLLSHSQGDGTFEMADQSGDIMSGLTGIYPYVSYTGTGWDVWGSAGIGLGQVEMLELKGDVVSQFGALGMRGKLVSGGTIGLNYHGDFLMTGAEVADHDLTAEVYRVRAGLEASARITGAIRPYLEANVRQDGGSAETGTGLELGGGIRFSRPAWRLRGNMHTQGLVVHTVGGFTEWGISGLLQVGNRSEGMMMRLRPSWGRGRGMSLYRQQTMLDSASIGTATNRTELELGYRIPWMDRVARSVAGVTRLPKGVIYRLGSEFRPLDRVTFSIFGFTYAYSDARGNVGVNAQGAFQY